jgi:hypothetical protein
MRVRRRRQRRKRSRCWRGRPAPIIPTTVTRILCSIRGIRECAVNVASARRASRAVPGLHPRRLYLAGPLPGKTTGGRADSRFCWDYPLWNCAHAANVIRSGR